MDGGSPVSRVIFPKRHSPTNDWTYHEIGDGDMPFRMRVSDVFDEGAALSLSGRIEEGSYIGPEFVLLCDEKGQWVDSTITQHTIQFLKNWPVVPGDGSTVILSIAKPYELFKLDPRQSVIGQGAINRNPNRVDISTGMSDPAFWAIWVPLHVSCDALPEPSLAWGLSSDEANDEHAERFQSHWDSGAWPFVRLELPEGRYVEIEFAAGVEPQNRVWVGDDRGRRVLLGYDSGHFSFPTMRMQELLNLAARIDAHPSAPLLLLAGAYLGEGEPFPSNAVRRWLLHSPGFQAEYLEALLPEFADNVVTDLKWEFTEERGWINNWAYSQRNPASPMSILRLDDFRFIHEFLSI